MAISSFAILKQIGSIKIDEGNEIRFSVDAYKQSRYLSVRKYLKSETYSGPTKAGITLTSEVVIKIAKALATLPDDINSIKDGELGKYARRQGLAIVLRVSSFNTNKGIDIRQWQEDETYTGWTKKGIRLPLEKLAEIKELFTRSVPPTTVKGVKRRCRAGFGKCQGGFCSPSVTLILAKHYGVSPLDIKWDKEASNILKEEVKKI